MSVQTNQFHSNKSALLVQQLRQQILEDYENNRDLYDENDINRITTNDWYVKRFLLARGRKLDQSFNMMRDTLRWRKQIGLTTVKDSDFPCEFYKVGGLFSYEKDRNGYVVIYMRIRMHRKITELVEPTKMFLLHAANKADLETDGNGTVIVFDCSDAGYANMDLEFLKFLISTATSYFPVGLKYILVYELSWFLNAFRKIAMSFVPENLKKIIKFANKNDITEYIAKENLPDYMGGTCTRNYRAIPEGCTTVAKVALEHGYTQQDVDRLMPLYKPLLDEADAIIAKSNYTDPNQSIRANGHVINKSNELVVSENMQKYTQLLTIEPNETIQFIYDSQLNVYKASVTLENIINFDVAFKIQSNNPQNYYVSPPNGKIEANAKLLVNIELNAISYYKYKTIDKFLILAQAIDSKNVASNNLTKLWQRHHPNIVRYKLLSDTKSINYDYVKLNNRNTSESKTQIYLLEQKCGQLERRQQNLFILLTIMLIVIFFLSIFIFYKNSYYFSIS